MEQNSSNTQKTQKAKQKGLQILSINVNGLNAQNKRGRIFKQLRKARADIICLQETHLKEADQKYLSCPKLGQYFYASDQKKKRGVATYISDDLKPKLIEKTSDGRVLIVEFRKDEQKILLVNIYAPNEKQLEFFCNLQTLLRKYNVQNICVIGDFNAILDVELDRRSIQKRKKIKANLLQKNFLDIREEFDLVDMWRVQNGSSRQFTFYSHRHQTWTRIDQCWMSICLIKDVLEADILPKSYADHNPLLIKIYTSQRRYNWKMNTFDLNQEGFRDKLNTETREFLKINDNGETDKKTI